MRMMIPHKEVTRLLDTGIMTGRVSHWLQRGLLFDVCGKVRDTAWFMVWLCI